MSLHFLPEDSLDEQSILVLAGDISSSLPQLIDFLEFVEKRFYKVIYVPGNHEYYKSNMQEWILSVDALFKSRLKNTVAPLLTGVETITLGGLFFVMSTLWGDGGKNPMEEIFVQNGLNDFRLIGYQENKFTVAHMQQLNKLNKEKIECLINSQQEYPVVVVTHHLPSYSLCHPRFGHSINGGFASDCDHMMVDGVPALWIHGHTHDTIDTDLYGTRIVSNPHGYRGETNTSIHNRYNKKFISIHELKHVL